MNILSILYVISMTINFTYLFGGVEVTFWYRHAISLCWIVPYFAYQLLVKEKIKGREAVYIKTYVYPLICMFIWSLLMLLLNMAGVQYITRMISTIIYLLTPVLCAMVCARIFGTKVIKLSAWAVVLSILINFVCSTLKFGIGILAPYLTQITTVVEFPFGSRLQRYSMALEVQDATIGIGFYILYFMFMDKEDTRKQRLFYIIMLVMCSYIGFKRTQFIALIATAIALFIIKKV